MQAICVFRLVVALGVLFAGFFVVLAAALPGASCFQPAYAAMASQPDSRAARPNRNNASGSGRNKAKGPQRGPVATKPARAPKKARPPPRKARGPVATNRS